VVWVGTLVGPWIGYGPGERGVVDRARDLEMARWLAWGVLVAGLAPLAVQVPALRREGILGPREPRPAGSPSAWAVIRASAPLALGAAVYQINVMMDGLMAEGLLPDGGPTLHDYANRVQSFPMALIAISATSAVFPAL
jgi:putative peptidoglycan lipid II flippase